MVCSCGARYPDKDEFCYYCGARNSEYRPPAPVEDTTPDQPHHSGGQPFPGQQPYQGPQDYQGRQYYQDRPPYPGQQHYHGQNDYYHDQYQERAATRAANISLVCGIVGFFIGGLILGIIAVMQGNKARRFGYPGGKATVGIVLGAIDIIAWAILVFAMFGSEQSLFFF